MLQEECGFFDQWILSTESEGVKEQARKYGFNEAYTRPSELSLSTSTVWDAVLHAMKTIPETDIIVLLHPTSPCLRVETITQIVSDFILNFDSLEALVSVSYISPYVYERGEIPDFSNVKMSQNCVEKFALNNAINIVKWNAIKKNKNIFKCNWFPCVIDADEAIDIDDKTDFEMAEAILQWRQRNEEVT